MRRCLALLLVVASFALASRSHAAAVNITVSLEPGTTKWDLRIDSLASSPIGAVSLVVSDSLGSFSPAPDLPPIICGLADCFEQPLVSGLELFSLGFPASGSPPPLFDVLVPPDGSRMLGTFNATVGSASLVQVLPVENVVGGHTLLDTSGTAIADFAIHVVPESGGIAWLSLAAALVAIARARPGSVSSTR